MYIQDIYEPSIRVEYSVLPFPRNPLKIEYAWRCLLNWTFVWYVFCVSPCFSGFQLLLLPTSIDDSIQLIPSWGTLLYLSSFSVFSCSRPCMLTCRVFFVRVLPRSDFEKALSRHSCLSDELSSYSTFVHNLPLPKFLLFPTFMYVYPTT